MLLMKEFTTAAALAIALNLCFPLTASSAESASSAPIADRIAPRLQQGDLVRLHSGGPLMTVFGIKGDQVECIWTDWNGQTADATFPAKVLQKF